MTIEESSVRYFNFAPQIICVKNFFVVECLPTDRQVKKKICSFRWNGVPTNLDPAPAGDELFSFNATLYNFRGNFLTFLDARKVKKLPLKL